MSATNPAPYPGNASLPREVREKILSTFRHTLNLFGEGKLDDCLIGCDFILKMDPRFAPARRLMEKARNPHADVDLAELEALVATTPTRQDRTGVDAHRLLVRAVESFNARDFDASISAAEQALDLLPGNEHAREILEQASAKKAAGPGFDAARKRAIAALDGKQPEAARSELAQMRQLDPDHPAVALLERRIGTAPPKTGGSDLEELSLDPVPAAGASPLHGESREPAIAFGSSAPPGSETAPPPPFSPPSRGENAESGRGLDSLSLDALSLDLPPASAQLVPPPDDPRSPRIGPLGSTVPSSRPAPLGSPEDLWKVQPSSKPEEAPRAPAATPLPPPASYASPSEEPQTAEREIAALLKQGDDAAGRGERQQAIEIWSRIFLIDINNTEAVTRIEKARQELVEGNRVISDGLKTGREKYEAGDLAGARELFLRVLAVDESETTARFYLGRIEEDLRRGAPPSAVPTAGSEPVRKPAAKSAAPAAPPSGPGLRLPVMQPRVVLVLVGAFVLLSLVGVFFVFLSKPRPAPPAATAPPAAGSVARAPELAENNLDRPQAPRPIAVTGSSPALPSQGAPSEAGLESDPSRLRALGEKSLAEKRYIDALKNFHLAAPAFRNDPTFAKAMGIAAEKVTALTPAVKLYNEAEYETAIPVLWRITQEDRDNQDARSYLLRAYYNQGVTQLQNGLYPKAVQSFNEALALDPSDVETSRHRKFAERYQKGDLDLMGRIYVRHLSHRP